LVTGRTLPALFCLVGKTIPEIDELVREVTPEKVLDTIDKYKEDSIKENGGDF
jgi:hypothetical protein